MSFVKAVGFSKTYFNGYHAAKFITEQPIAQPSRSSYKLDKSQKCFICNISFMLSTVYAIPQEGLALNISFFHHPDNGHFLGRVLVAPK